MYSKPFLKWVGGKTQIISAVLQHIPTSICNYYEPFLGGGSVLIAVLESVIIGDRVITGTTYAFDLNNVLVHTFINIQTRPDDVITHLKQFVDEMNDTSTKHVYTTSKRVMNGMEAHYYIMRDLYNHMDTLDKESPRGSALFIFLNKTCFRGIHREGPNGFNVPYGHYKNPSVYNVEHIKYISKLIQPVVFRCCKFETLLSTSTFGTDDFIYMDPPYVKLAKTSFDGYTSDGFNSDRLFVICKDLDSRKVRITMSNSKTDKVLHALKGWHILCIDCKRSIHAYDPSSKTIEIIATNW